MLEHERPDRPARRASTETQRQYRLYFLEGIDSLISFSHEFEAADDEQAIRISEVWRAKRRAELWCGPTKVKSWDSGR